MEFYVLLAALAQRRPSGIETLPDYDLDEVVQWKTIFYLKE